MTHLSHPSTHLIYPSTNFKAIEELTLTRGEGVYVWDDQGKQYLEGMAGLWCAALGHGNQEVIDAASQQMRQLSYASMFGGKTHPKAIALADRLSAMLPMRDAAVFFGNSGSDANDSHVRMLRYYHAAIGAPEKRKIIARERSYHGVTVASASLTGLPVMQQHFDLPIEALGILRTDHPHYFRGRHAGESEAEFVDRIVANLEALIVREGPETIAAFIAEPITGASGVIVPPDGYYPKVQAILRKYEILFWADEVITGFGRTGHPFGVTTMGIDTPDLMTLAKQLSAAYVPISAAAIRGDMYEAMIEQSAQSGIFGHGYTYSGHPVACAVALAVLDIYERDDMFARAAKLGEYMQARLRELEGHPLVGEVRGRGLLAALELVTDPATGATAPGVAAYAQQAALEHGLIVRAVAGTALAFCPPLVITQAQLDEMVAKTATALDQTLAHCRSQGLLAG
jgi:4-aminobutyrate--pyruvate transaminase